MKTPIALVTALSVAAVCGCNTNHAAAPTPTPRAAVESPSAGPGEARPRSTMRYNPATVETLSGEVVAMGEYRRTPSGGGSVFRGPQVTLKTEKETVGALVAPPPFLEQRGIKIDLHDTIEITGSRVDLPNGPFIFAREVKKGNTVAKVRSKEGVPLWFGSLRPGRP